MPFVFRRRLALPLWAIVFFTVALTAPPPALSFPMPPITLFVMAALGTAGIIVMMSGLVDVLRTSRSVVRPASGQDNRASRAGVTMTAGICTHTLEPNRSERDEALDLVRMDDDGGWQMPRPPA